MSVTLEECMILIREHNMHPGALHQVRAVFGAVVHGLTAAADARSVPQHRHAARERAEEHWRAALRLQHAAVVCAAQAVPAARGDVRKRRGMSALRVLQWRAGTRTACIAVK